MTDGLDKKVDNSTGKVTIAHGPMASHNMPAMTMVFQVMDPAWLDKMKEGDKLRFMAEKVNGAFTVTQFEQAK
jgi:Cu(I)/Ag(I) efflux system protein CusF